MRRKSLVILVIVAGVLALAVFLLWPDLPQTATQALVSADHYELLSIESNIDVGHSADDFHGHKVLGHTFVTDPAIRERLLVALRGGVRTLFVNRPRCFSPRLGIRVTTGSQSTDFVICFECHQGQAWQGDRMVANWTTDASPKPAFDRVLQSAGVPLPADE